ncbi:MAG TPA: pyridoxamine kinase [Patescibacteria group bacterium]|nr:pyridoxamine kinase [Patescibacteria group bacterium]
MVAQYIEKIPRVAAVHDLSCVGRCSLSVIIPVLSVMGVQVCPLPTAVLSSHLGGFNNLEFCDFTEQMPAFFRHWQREGLSFDCIYSGFLASAQQMDIVHTFIEEFSGNRPLVLVDPVMGDEGKLYSTYTPAMQEHMRSLVSKADVITPNYTEACFLLGESYQENLESASALKEWLVRLAAFGPDRIVLTGIPVADKVVNLAYDRRENKFWEIANPQIDARYPGTGDVFASVLLGALLRQDALPAAVKQAANFVSGAIAATFRAGTDRREGVLLERVLPQLCRSAAGSSESMSEYI